MWLTSMLYATVSREFSGCHHTLHLAFRFALFFMPSCVVLAIYVVID
jgi:hypothetical protein